MPISLTKPDIGSTNWGAAVNQNWTDIENAINGYISTTSFNSPPSTTSTIGTPINLSSIIKVGTPIKFKQNDTYYYAVCTAITSSVITIAGAPLNTGLALQELWYGRPEYLLSVNFFVAGRFALQANTALLASVMKTYFQFNFRQGYLVKFLVRAAQNDSGANQPRVNVDVAGNPVSTSNSNAGLALPASNWAETGIDISTANYAISSGTSVEIRVDNNGSNKDAENLTVSVMFVLE